MKKFISLITVLTLLAAAIALTLSAFAGPENIVGYSAQRVEKKDLTNVTDIMDYATKSNETEYKISDIDGWHELEYWVNDQNKTFKGVTVYLADNIYPETKEIIYGLGKTTSKPTTHYYFAGTFDGQGYTIENVTVQMRTTSNGGGIIGFVKGATVKNLIVGENVKMNFKNSQSAAIVGRVDDADPVVIDNCWNKASVTFDSTMNGGIVGCTTNADGNVTVSNCTNSGKITSQERVGGIVGRSASNITIKNCLNTGEVIATDVKTVEQWKESNNQTTSAGETVARKMGVAGILAETTKSAAETVVEGCINTGKITGSKVIAGIVGFNPVGGGATVKNCANYGVLNLLQTSGYKGQIIGHSNEPANIQSDNSMLEGQTWTPAETDPPADPIQPNRPEADTDPITPDTDPVVPDTDPVPEDTKGSDNSNGTSASDNAGSEEETTGSDDGGCGSALAGSALAIVGVISLATVLLKRRKDEIN